MSTRAEQIALTRELNKHITKANDFYRSSQMDAAVDTDTITVHESTQMPPRGKNPQRLPLPVYTSEDTKKSYKNHTFVTHVVAISQENEALTSFNKRRNEAEKHGDQLIEDYADTTIYNWCPSVSGSIYRTTGGNTGFTTGAMTGTRKAVTKSDILAVHRILDNHGAPKKGRVCLMDTGLFYEILQITDFAQAQITGLVDPWIEGDLARRLGVDRIYVRDGAAFYDNTGTPVPQPLVGEATDNDELENYAPVAASNLAILFWHPRYVRHSFGMAQMWVENGGGRYKGSTLVNGQVRGGSMISRIDEKGVVALVQQP